MSENSNQYGGINWEAGGVAVGGTTMIGLGVGFFLLPQSALYFVASLLIGIGAGLVLATFFRTKNE